MCILGLFLICAPLRYLPVITGQTHKAAPTAFTLPEAAHIPHPWPNLTRNASEITGIAPEKFIGLINELDRDNIGLGGQLLSDILK